MKQKTVLVVMHSLFSDSGDPVSGTGAPLFDVFDRNKISFTRVHFPIYGGHHILIFEHLADNVRRSVLQKTPLPLLVRTWEESRVIFSLFKKQQFIDVFIGIDPLNALWGIVGKYMLKKIGHMIYYTADYADNRFANPVLNWVYHTIDRICIRYADQVWNVSTRILEKRAAQGVPGNRNYFIPNAPAYISEKQRQFDKYRLIIVGTSTTALDFAVVMSSIPGLLARYPKLRLHIVGGLHFAAAIHKKISYWVKKRIIVLHGSLKRDKVYKLLIGSGIGLALYKDKDPWTRYGDSMKIREYLSAGLPVITTDIVSTSEVVEEYGCGRVISATTQSLISAVSGLYAGDYQATRRAARRAAKRYAFIRMVRRPLSLVGITV